MASGLKLEHLGRRTNLRWIVGGPVVLLLGLWIWIFGLWEAPRPLLGASCVVFGTLLLLAGIATTCSRSAWVVLAQTAVLLSVCVVDVQASMSPEYPSWVVAIFIAATLPAVIHAIRWLGNYRLLRQLEEFKARQASLRRDHEADTRPRSEGRSVS